MDEDFNECYSEWANDELIWGRGQFNWCRAYSHDKWEKKNTPTRPDYDDIEIPF